MIQFKLYLIFIIVGDLSRKAMLGGLTAGGLAQFIASPTDLVKVQMQMEGRRRLEGQKPR